jgi:hypothetical protein
VKGQAATDNEARQRKLVVKKKKKQPYEGPNCTMPRFTNKKSHGSQQNWEIVKRKCHKTPKNNNNNNNNIIRLMKTTEIEENAIKHLKIIIIITL